MAKFKNGDWVEISKNVNRSAQGYTPGYSEDFCGKICRVVRTETDPQTGMVILKVELNGKMAWFESDQAIQSSKYEKEYRSNMERAASDLQEWEKMRKKAVDDMFRKVLGLDKEEEYSNPKDYSYDENSYYDNAFSYDKEDPTLEEIEDANDYDYEYDDDWEEKTDPVNVAPMPSPSVFNKKTKSKVQSNARVLSDEELEELLQSLGSLK